MQPYSVRPTRVARARAVWRGNVVLLSPSTGPFGKEFADLGVAVWIGDLDELLARVTDVRVAICNTIMTAHVVLGLADRAIPSMWILHEWWPEEMLVSELTKRNDKNTTPAVVRKALAVCARTVCVCKAQHEYAHPRAARIGRAPRRVAACSPPPPLSVRPVVPWQAL